MEMQWCGKNLYFKEIMRNCGNLLPPYFDTTIEISSGDWQARATIALGAPAWQFLLRRGFSSSNQKTFIRVSKKYSYISIECVIEMFPLPTKSSLFETRLDEDNNFILFLRLLLLSFPPPTHLPITPMSMANKVYWAVLMRCVSRWTNQFVQSIMSDRREAAAVRPNHCFRAISPHYSAPNRALLYISSESSLALRLYHQWLSRQPTTLLPVWLFNVSLRSSCTTSASNIFCICSTSIHGLHLYSAFFSALVISAGDQATVWSRWQTDLSASPPISNWPPHSPSSPLPSI